MITIVFEDCGQDFLEWDVEPDGTVTASRPFQGWLWIGTRVTNLAKLAPGKLAKLAPGKLALAQLADVTQAGVSYATSQYIVYPVVELRRSTL